MADTPTVKNMKVFAIVESAIELPHGFSISQFFDYLRHNKFRGETNVTSNHNQGGITNVVTREHIPLTMIELDRILGERNK